MVITCAADRGRLRTLVPTIGFLFCCVFGAPRASAAECSVVALSSLGIPDVTITSTKDVPAVAPNSRYCDVKGSVRTNGEGAGPGSANFEAMLPSNWNGKFIFRGVGGLAGTFRSPDDKTLFHDGMIQAVIRYCQRLPKTAPLRGMRLAPGPGPNRTEMVVVIHLRLVTIPKTS